MGGCGWEGLIGRVWLGGFDWEGVVGRVGLGGGDDAFRLLCHLTHAMIVWDSPG